MTELLQHLELRTYKAKTIIHHELDTCLEILFVCKGKYDYGYEVNKKKMFRRQFGPCTIIGGFQTIYEQRNQFVIRAHTDIQGYAISRKNLKKIQEKFHQFFDQIKEKLLVFYY